MLTWPGIIIYWLPIEFGLANGHAWRVQTKALMFSMVLTWIWWLGTLGREIINCIIIAIERNWSTTLLCQVKAFASVIGARWRRVARSSLRFFSFLTKCHVLRILSKRFMWLINASICIRRHFIRNLFPFTANGGHLRILLCLFNSLRCVVGTGSRILHFWFNLVSFAKIYLLFDVWSKWLGIVSRARSELCRLHHSLNLPHLPKSDQSYSAFLLCVRICWRKLW